MLITKLQLVAIQRLIIFIQICALRNKWTKHRIICSRLKPEGCTVCDISKNLSAWVSKCLGLSLVLVLGKSGNVSSRSRKKKSRLHPWEHGCSCQRTAIHTTVFLVTWHRRPDMIDYTRCLENTANVHYCNHQNQSQSYLQKSASGIDVTYLTGIYCEMMIWWFSWTMRINDGVYKFTWVKMRQRTCRPTGFAQGETAATVDSFNTQRYTVRCGRSADDDLSFAGYLCCAHDECLTGTPCIDVRR